MKTAFRTTLALVLLALAAHSQDSTPSTREAVNAVPAGAIRVRVVDDGGHSVPDVWVAVRPMTKEREVPEQGLLKLKIGGWKRASTWTDAGGTALVEGLEPGPYRAAAGRVPKWWCHFSDPIDVGSEATVTLTPIPPGRVLSGVVLQPDGEPKGGATVRFVWSDRGHRKEVHARSDKRGGFNLVADEPGVSGTLQATMYKYTLRSTAIDDIKAGTTGIELRLGEPRFLTLDVRDQNEAVIEHPNATFYWKLAGFLFHDYPGPRRERGKPISWELPSTPFHVTVQAAGYEVTQLGPLDPETIGSPLVVHMKSLPRLRGHVVHNGKPVAGARVSLWKESKRWGYGGQADEDGRYEVIMQQPGTFEVRAWRQDLGEGSAGPILWEPETESAEVDIEITRAPGTIAGKVLVPPDHDPREIWLTTTRGHGFMRLEPDGSFELPDLPAGKVTIHIRQGYDMGATSLPISTSTRRDPGSRWFSMSHGPSRGPDWLVVEPVFDVEVRSGKTTTVELDLVAPAACSLQGRILLNGEPPSYKPEERNTYGRPAPRVVLDRGDENDYVSRTELAADGTFALSAAKPGTYRLRIEVPIAAQYSWVVTDEIELVIGTRSWEMDTPSGSLRVLPRETDHQGFSYTGKVRRNGPGQLEIVGQYGITNKDTRVVTFPSVPEGHVEIFHSTGEQKTVLALEIVAGEETTVRNP